MNKVQVNVKTPKISVNVGSIPEVRVGIGAAAAYPAYSGATTVTPSEQTQVLATAGLNMTGDITVNPIPSDWGHITWNGSYLTVS